MTASRNPYVNPNALLNDSLRIVTAVRERLPEIIAVANRMTDVDDLVQFQHQVNHINKYLALLVEASEIIIRVTKTGFDLITAKNPAAARQVLELGSAALRPEEFFATAEQHALLQQEVREIGDYLNWLVNEIRVNYATKDMLSDVRQEMLDALNTLAQTVGQIGNKVTELDGLFDRVDNLNQQMIGFGTEIDLIRDDYELLSTSYFSLRTTVEEFGDYMRTTSSQLTELSSRITDTETGLVAESTAREELRTEVTRQGNDIQATSQKAVDLESRLLLNEGQLEVLSTAQNDLTTLVQQRDNEVTALTQQVAQLEVNYTDMESGLELQGQATEELRTALQMTDDSVHILSEQTTKLSANLKSYNNLIPNSDWTSGISGWSITQRGPGWELPDLFRDVDPYNYLPASTHTLGVRVSPAPSGSICIESSPIPVGTGDRFIAQARLAGVNLTAVAEVVFYNVAGLVVPSDGHIGQSNPGDGGMSMDDWPEHWAEFPVPLGAASIAMRVWGQNATGAPAEVHILRPMIERAVEGQVGPSPWSPSTLGLSDALADAEERLSAEILATRDGMASIAQDVVDLSSAIGGLADADALELLQTQVTQMGDNITSFSQYVLQLQSRLPPGDTTPLATVAMLNEAADTFADMNQAQVKRMDELRAMVTPIGAADEDIGAGTETVGATQRTIQTVLAEADYALSERIDTFEVETEQTFGTIQQTLRLEMQNGDQLLAQALDAFRLQTTDAMANIETSTRAYVDAAGVALTEQLDAMKTEVDGTTSTAINNLRTYVDQNNVTFSDALVDLHSQMGNAIADAKTELKTYVDNQGNSISQQITTLQTEFTGVTQAMIARTETLENGMLTMSAKYMLNVSAGNRIGGMSLANDGNVVDVVFLADNFNIVSTSTTNGIEIRNGYLRSWGGGAQAIMGNGFGVNNNLMFFIGANVGADNAQLSNALIVADNQGNLYVNGIIQANKIAGQFQTTGGGIWTGNIPANTGGATPSITFDAPNSSWGHRPYITLEVTLKNDSDHSRDGYIILQRWDSTQSLWVNVRRKYFLASSSTITTNIVMVIDGVRYDAQQYRVKTEVGTSSWGSWALWEVQMFIVGIK